MFKKILSLASKHRFITVAIVISIILAGYFGYKALQDNGQKIRYVLAAVEKGTLITSISGGGQVSASDEVSIKPKVSGDVIYVGVKNGQEVKKGKLLAQIDANDARRAVENAEIALETAKVQLEDLLKPADELEVLQVENSLTKAKSAKQEAEQNIIDGHEDAFNSVADVFFDLPTIMTNLGNILYSYEIANKEPTLSGYWNIAALGNSLSVDDRSELERLITMARKAYNEVSVKYAGNFDDYKNTSRYAEEKIIETLLGQTTDTLKAASEAIRNEINMLDSWVYYRSRRNERIFSTVTDYQSNLKSYNSKINSYFSNLLQARKSLDNNKQALLDAEYSIKERELTLEKLMESADDLELRTKKLQIQQREADLSAVRQDLYNCYVYAPFDGVITEVNVKRGDTLSGSTAVATLITKQRIAEISLNETDVAKLEVGQKTTLAFDAVESLNLTGEVAEIDALGTVTQGVVNYNVKIIFDTQDDRIKPGMTTSASIIVGVAQNVLLVPNSAIKQSNGVSYVQVPESTEINEAMLANASGATLTTSPRQQTVQTGASNDEYIEIVNGLSEGDIVVSQIITSTTISSSQRSNSNFRIPSGGMMRD